jgi:octanoyl-[GcvH]:protein N-octanoyltransferase
LTLLPGSLGDAELDMAATHTLLRRVGAGELEATARVFRPRATVTFGKLDAVRPGYPAAAAAARAHGFAPVLRIAGGHAAAFDEGSVVVELVTPSMRVAEGISERFAAGSNLLTRVLREAGVDARVGELPGEYCPGGWSVHAGGVKLAGPAQRSIRGAALWSSFVAVEGGARLRAVLTDVYAALALDWRPQTAGAAEDVRPGIRAEAVEAALATAVGGCDLQSQAAKTQPSRHRP